jgi:hypothetical protein
MLCEIEVRPLTGLLGRREAMLGWWSNGKTRGNMIDGQLKRRTSATRIVPARASVAGVKSAHHMTHNHALIRRWGPATPPVALFY